MDSTTRPIKKTRSRGWFSVALTICESAFRNYANRTRAHVEQLDRKAIIYGAFKGMGDLLCAAPVIASELTSGVDVTLLLFPHLQTFADLIDFGPNRNNLHIVTLPFPMKWSTLRPYLNAMRVLTPDLVWYSPHSPLNASSWKIPLLLALTKRRYWSAAKLAGAQSERLSWLFDIRLPIDRTLPYALRELTAYKMMDPHTKRRHIPTIRFTERIQRTRHLPPLYDLLIHPGASASNRKWPHKYYGELLQYLPDHWRVAITALPDDVNNIQAVLPPGHRVDFITGALEDAIKSIARARLAVTMDSGPMFFAKVLGVPTIVLFGPSDPKQVVESSPDIVPIFTPTWPCQPCSNARCHQKETYCMQSIDPLTVAKELAKRLPLSQFHD